MYVCGKMQQSLLDCGFFATVPQWGVAFLQQSLLGAWQNATVATRSCRFGEPRRSLGFAGIGAPRFWASGNDYLC